MFELDQAISRWRLDFHRRQALSSADLDELEDHLRAAYEVELMLAPALAPEHAFNLACESLGTPELIAREFSKVEGRAWRWLLRGGRVLFGLSFLLPVARYGITLGDLSFSDGLLPGVQAIILAIGGTGGPLGVLSGVTNLIILAAFGRIRNAGRRRVRLLAGLATFGVLLNLSWLWLIGTRSDLFVGYYTWLSSFGLTASALWLRARALPADTPSRRPALAR